MSIFWYARGLQIQPGSFNCSLTLVLLNLDVPRLCILEPDHLVSIEGNWSGSALFVIKYGTLYQQPGSRNLIG